MSGRRREVTSKAEQKAQTRETILSSAARVLSERGISGASVADVMAGAGLTVGGFYAHFASKTALLDEAILRRAATSRSNLFAGLEAWRPDERIGVVLKRYLSRTHRDEAATGCCLPAVVGEVGTTAPEHAGAVAAAIELQVSEIRALLPDPESDAARQQAIATFALMVGGLSLARALEGTPLSDEVLRACRAVGARAAHAEHGGSSA